MGRLVLILSSSLRGVNKVNMAEKERKKENSDFGFDSRKKQSKRKK